MNRNECLDGARSAVSERGISYGKAEDNFALIARMWSAWLGVPVTAVDVAIMMGHVKDARLKNTPDHADSWIDKAGYAACGAEVATEGNTADKVVSLSRSLTDPRQDDGA